MRVPERESTKGWTEDEEGGRGWWIIVPSLGEHRTELNKVYNTVVSVNPESPEIYSPWIIYRSFQTTPAPVTAPGVQVSMYSRWGTAGRLGATGPPSLPPASRWSEVRFLTGCKLYSKQNLWHLALQALRGIEEWRGTQLYSIMAVSKSTPLIFPQCGSFGVLAASACKSQGV